jgi:hypothetical protein
MGTLEKLVILGGGAFLGARYLAGRITNNSGGAVTVNPKPELPQVEAPKNTGIVPPNFTPPAGFTGPIQQKQDSAFSGFADGNLMASTQGQLLQQMNQFRTVFA